jgi:hypothetical protein
MTPSVKPWDPKPRVDRGMVLAKWHVTDDFCRCDVFGAAVMPDTTRRIRESYGDTPDKLV